MAEVKKNTADRVYENLFHMLVSGDYAPGDRIPSEHELKERFNVSRNTIRAALNRMNALGIIETRQGDGTYLKGVGTGMPGNRPPVSRKSWPNQPSVLVHRFPNGSKAGKNYRSD